MDTKEHPNPNVPHNQPYQSPPPPQQQDPTQGLSQGVQNAFNSVVSAADQTYRNISANNARFHTPSFGMHPLEMECPNCRRPITTEVKKSAGPGAWLTCLGFSVFGLFCGCCLIPFFIDSMQVYTHSCPSCKLLLGKYAGPASFAEAYSITQEVDRAVGS